MISVPVLLYHHVSDDREVTLRDFDSHLKLLADRGYRTIRLKDMLEHLLGRREAPARSVMITFDDGYADNWVCAFPLLKKYSMNAVIFVTTGSIDTAGSVVRPTTEQGAAPVGTLLNERGPSGFMSWAELKTMTASGLIEVGSHTHTHRNFVRSSGYGDVEKELVLSRELIEKNLGAWHGAVAWPWGDFDPAWSEILRKAGYETAFAVSVGPNVPGGDPFAVNRFKVRKGRVRWLASRLWLYSNAFPAAVYGSIYGLDRRIKTALRDF